LSNNNEKCYSAILPKKKLATKPAPSVIKPLNATCMQCMLIHQQGAASRIGVTSIAAAYAIQGERAMAACRMQTQPEA
jgi:hypothetical protein